MSNLSIILLCSSPAKAMIKGEPETEQWGDSNAEAVGRVILVNQERFGLKIDYVLPERARTPLEEAFSEFNGNTCYCGNSKQERYWFCQRCWNLVRKIVELRERLWRKNFNSGLQAYYAAKAALKKVIAAGEGNG